MVLRLAQALRLSLRQRNHLLEAAGFRAAFPGENLGDDSMAELRSAVELILQQLSPNPALAADRHWNVYMANSPMSALLGALQAPHSPDLSSGPPEAFPNLMEWIWQPEGLRAHCRNWEQVAPMIWRQLCDDALSTDSPILHDLVRRYAAEAAPLGSAHGAETVPPMLPLVLDIQGQELHVVSLITRFGSPSSTTAEELRIETFIPADDSSRKLLLSLGD
jgi:hypothetical protein